MGREGARKAGEVEAGRQVVVGRERRGRSKSGRRVRGWALSVGIKERRGGGGMRRVDVCDWRVSEAGQQGSKTRPEGQIRSLYSTKGTLPKGGPPSQG